MIYFTTGEGTASDTLKGIFCGDQIYIYQNEYHNMSMTPMPNTHGNGKASCIRLRAMIGLSLVQVLMQVVFPECINHIANSTIYSMETTLKKIFKYECYGLNKKCSVLADVGAHL